MRKWLSCATTKDIGNSHGEKNGEITNKLSS